MKYRPVTKNIQITAMMPIKHEVNVMNDYKLQIHHDEHAKDLYREAENERLARSIRHQRNGVLKNARKALISARQNLLNRD